MLEQVQVLSVISWCWSRRRCCLLLTGGARITMVTKVSAHSVSCKRVLIKLSFNYTSQILGLCKCVSPRQCIYDAWFSLVGRYPLSIFCIPVTSVMYSGPHLTDDPEYRTP